MAVPIYKSRDAENIRVYAEEIRPDVWMFTHRQGVTATLKYEMTGEEAQTRIAEYWAADSLSFIRYYAGQATQLAQTGHTHAIPAAIVGGTLATMAALGFAFAPNANAPTGHFLSDVTTAPVVTPSPVTSEPYRPAPHTSREGTRKALTATKVPHVVTQSTKQATRHPLATPPADIRVSYYQVCEAHPQPCIDAGALTMYDGRILAGHNYMGYQWLSRVPVGRTVRVISGPLAGTYRVYGHLRINRQGGSIPAFLGSPALVLQTCEGSGTGFSLLHRM
jgi:hypothetical protein